MKIKLEMELADVLRISVLLDHHRSEAVANTDSEDDKSSRQSLWVAWGREAADLNAKLLNAVATGKETK